MCSVCVVIHHQRSVWLLSGKEWLLIGGSTVVYYMAKKYLTLKAKYLYTQYTCGNRLGKPWSFSWKNFTCSSRPFSVTFPILIMDGRQVKLSASWNTLFLVEKKSFSESSLTIFSKNIGVVLSNDLKREISMFQ